jgi:hypothetical protein
MFVSRERALKGQCGVSGFWVRAGQALVPTPAWFLVTNFSWQCWFSGFNTKSDGVLYSWYCGLWVARGTYFEI